MIPFLKTVAKDLLEKYGNNMSDIVMVFPNKRASLFINRYFAQNSDKPTWAPKYVTISDLFRQHSKLKVADPIKLICDLHKCFVECTGIDETLDHFYGWGQILISDFDDIDKNLADAEKVFSNLRDIHELDDISYLTNEQKTMIKKFFSNFSDDHNSELKKRFLQLWSHFYEIYQKYNDRLAKQGLAYEGALYRQVVNDEQAYFEYNKYIFVGFNMMQKVELELCDRLLKEDKAEFYWDYDTYYMKEGQEAGHYIKQYLERFPNALDDGMGEKGSNALSHEKDITYISAPTESSQAKYVSQWIKEDHRDQKLQKVAIVLADETLLPAVLHALPKDLKVNVTLGYPLQQTPFYSLIQQLIKLQGIGHVKNTDTYRLRQVLLALRHPYAMYISERYADLLKDLEDNKRFYPTRQSMILDGDEGLALLFKDIDDVADKDAYNLALLDYLISILKLMGLHAKDLEDPLFQEALFRTYTLLNRLRGLIASKDLQVETITLEHLIQQLIQTTSIPFHGEPAEDIQIMGVLETRNLDFEHMLILSCNEGKLPKGVNDTSFIPYSIRKAYGLTTIDNKVAIYAYYFYRMIQRSKSLTITYNNATDEGQTGEMSRFMLQLLIESQQKIKRATLVAGQMPRNNEYTAVEKTEEMLDILSQVKLITPTLLNTYQRCEKRFYYKYIEGLKEPDEIDEDDVDNRVFGNIFHRAAELFYLRFACPSDIQTNAKGEPQLIHPIVITKGDLENALKDESLVYRLVDQAFSEELFKVSSKDFKPKYNGLQLINKEVIANYLKQLITIDTRQAPFTIIGLELVVSTQITVPTGTPKNTFKIGGFIDRLDAVAASGNPGESNLAERIRVIDYKTGRAQTSHPKDVAEIFDRTMLHKHSDYYLQALLYSIIVKHSKSLNPAAEPVSPGLLFIQNARAEDYDPTLKFGKGLRIEDVSEYELEFMDGIKDLISEIYDLARPFSPTEDKQKCDACPYAALCR